MPPKEVSMQSDLEMLLKLQVIDYDLGELERSKEYLPDMMENLHRELNEAQSKLKDALERFESGKLKQKELELEIKVKEGALQKYQQQMMSIKTNKEYDALVAEIDNIKEAISLRESELLETIDVVGVLEKEIGGLREREAQVTENNTRQLKILQEKIDSIGAKVSAKEAVRHEVVTGIPKPTLQTYERVRRGKGGQIVVAVRKRACGSCYKSLTPKKIQEIKRADRVHTCDNCGCLLYWDDAESN
jgi:predicted  nucleic acid-binding Zn-ribbon protein